MSAFRQLLAGLWAAVWLRGRLLGLRLRALFDGRAETGAGPDFHLLGADVLAEEDAHEPIDIPPELAARLEATRLELLVHARKTVASRPRPRVARRRRAASVAMATLLGLGIVGAGASALVTGSTGVSEVDRLLGIYESGLDKPGASERPGPSGDDLQPSPSSASEPIEVTLADGSKSEAAFYVARDGRICSAVADSAESGPVGKLACDPPSAIADGLARDEGYVSAIDGRASGVIVKGYVSDRVASLKGDGPGGSLRVHLGEPWLPSVSDAGALRPFVAVGPASASGELPAGLELIRLLDRRNYSFDAVLGDGRKTNLAP